MAQLNQQYVAAQISLAAVGSGILSGAMNSSLRCYGISFDSMTLDNGFALNRSTLLKDLLAQARLAIIENRSDDMLKLAEVLHLLETLATAVNSIKPGTIGSDMLGTPDGLTVTVNEDGNVSVA